MTKRRYTVNPYSFSGLYSIVTPTAKSPGASYTITGKLNKWSPQLSKALLSFAIACFVIATGCTTPGAHRPLAQNAQAPGASPKVLAVYMPWFGDHTHEDVGYSSQDPGVLRKQIQEAHRMGISAFVVDWYGASRPYSDHNFG